jgi:CubicO group peptidase (beta-lactamase class C family)
MKNRYFAHFTRLLILGYVLCLSFSSIALAEVLPVVVPEEVGISSERLKRIDINLQADIEQNKYPGVVALIARHGKIAYFKSYGLQNTKTGAPMQQDSIFRIYSMTKPIVSVAFMTLVEEGKVFLSDKVSKYLPEFKDLKVGIEEVDPATGKMVLKETVPVERQMTIQDLLRHTSGLTYGVFGKSPIKTLYLKAQSWISNQTSAELVTKLSQIPLRSQPGSRWEYSRSTDVLGRVIEVISGVTFDQFLKEQIFDPLNMLDSGFYVKPENHHRIAEAMRDPKTRKKANLLRIKKSPKFLSGGGGGVSTVSDYLVFCQMLLNGGEFNGTRIIGPKMIELMTSDHLGEIPGFSQPGTGFGLGFSVRTAAGMASTPGSIGSYSWGGYAGTTFWVDPKEELIAILMIQEPTQLGRVSTLFRNLVYQAIIE